MGGIESSSFAGHPRLGLGSFHQFVAKEKSHPPALLGIIQFVHSFASWGFISPFLLLVIIIVRCSVLIRVTVACSPFGGLCFRDALLASSPIITHT